MLLYSEKFIDMPIMSLQTSQELARTAKAVIDPAHLSIPAYYVSGQNLDFSPALLRTADIREIGNIGMIVNSSDEFVAPDDLVKMKNILELEFQLEEIDVIDDHNHKLGKVARYTIDPETFVIHQLYVRRPFLQSLSYDELLINRSQIIAIHDNEITVKAPDNKVSEQIPFSEKVLKGLRPPSQPRPETRDSPD